MSRQWWKILIIVLVCLVVRVLLLRVVPMSQTFELPLSSISRTIGMIPTAAIWISLMYVGIAVVSVWVQEGLTGSKLAKGLRCGIGFGAVWFASVLESSPALGKPILGELLVAVADVIPVILIGVLVGVFTAAESSRKMDARSNGIAILVIALAYLIGRYFAYGVVGINSGYTARPLATFLWTLGTGLAVGLMYELLKLGLRGGRSLGRALWFGGVVFGILWAMCNFFMPVVFDMSFIDFPVPLLNYVFRAGIDVLFVTIGAWIIERSLTDLPILNVRDKVTVGKV